MNIIVLAVSGGCLIGACLSIAIQLKRIADYLEGTPSASHNSASRAISEQYNELLMAVCKKYPNESCHETALRYIRQAESNSYCGSAPKQQA